MAEDTEPTETNGDALRDLPKAREPHFLAWAFAVVYCAEAGAVLLLLPWTQFWDGNRFFRDYPLLMKIGVNGFTRGAVSALGAALLYMCLEGVWRRLRRLRIFGGNA